MDIKRQRLLTYSTISLFIIFVLFWIKGSIFYSSFNIDEIILFFTSRGFFPGEAPSDPTIINPLGTMFLVNRAGGSLDPGMFTYLLRIWSFGSTQTWWLRSLPMLFFLLTLFLFFFSLKKQSNNTIISLLLSTLLFTNTLLLDYAFTIRPYSMEYCGLAFIFYLLLSNRETKRDNFGENFLKGLVLAFFVGSRYLFWIPLSLYFFFEIFIFKKVPIKFILTQSIAPLIAGLIYIGISYRFQLNLLPILYAQASFLKNLELLQIKIHFFTHKLWFIIIPPIYLYLFKREEYHLNQPIWAISLFSFCLTVVYIFLDLFGISPIHFRERYSLGFQVFTIFPFSLILLDLITHYLKKDAKRFIFTMLCTFLFFGEKSFNYDFKQNSDLVPIMRWLEQYGKKDEIVYCENITYAMVLFLRNYNSYSIDWNQMPEFRKFKSDKAKTEEYKIGDYFFVVSGTDYLYSIDDTLRNDPKLSKAEGYYFHKLYKNSYKEINP